MSRQSVLVVGTFLSRVRCGPRSVCEDLADRLADLGWDVLGTSSATNRVRRVADMLWTIWHERANYRIAHVDVYSGRAFLWAEAACWLLRRVKRPFILTLHGGNLPVFAHEHGHRVRELLDSASAVTAPSTYLQEAMRPYRDDIILVPNPLDIPRYQYHVRTSALPKLIWLRSFLSFYNPQLAVKVLSHLSSEFPSVFLTMVGRDRGDGSLRQTEVIAQELQVKDRCAFIPGVSNQQVPATLQRGDVFLNTTNIDNTPISVLEAMACGLCVVSTNVGGIPFLLTDEHDALLVPPNDPDAMSIAVGRLLTEPTLAERISTNARRTAMKCDWSVVLPQWKNLFLSIK